MIPRSTQRVPCQPAAHRPDGPDPISGSGPWLWSMAEVTKTDLSDIYRSYIACLNAQDWPKLGQFVATNASHNGQQIGLSGYRAMLENDFDDIPICISISSY